MHTVAVVALPDVIAFDLTTAVEVFGRVVLPSGEPGYRVLVCGTESVVSAGPMRIAADHGISEVDGADTIVVPGRNDVSVGTPDEVLRALKSTHADGTRIASICSGAFTLAEAGLLDGKRATTHWLAADLFRATYPEVDLDPDVLYVDEGSILTSAGSAAGLDLSLHLVRRDFGPAIANQVARRLVLPAHRNGGQRQYVEQPVPPRENARLADVVADMRTRVDHPFTVAELARAAAMSERTFNRRFIEATGEAPGTWLIRARVERARELLESEDLPMEELARRSGFGSPATLRHHFRRLLSTSPSAYRERFGRT